MQSKSSPDISPESKKSKIDKEDFRKLLAENTIFRGGGFLGDPPLSLDFKQTLSLIPFYLFFCFNFIYEGVLCKVFHLNEDTVFY